MTITPATYDHVDRSMQECVEECSTCHHVCLLTSAHCLSLGGVHAEPGHLTLLADCADICLTTANLLLRGSEHYEATCAACLEICRACEASCATIRDDVNMRECGDACRRCAEACQKLTAHMKSNTT